MDDIPKPIRAIRGAPVPCVPKSLHWLGDRAEAAGTGHEDDMRGCVMYFERQSDCLEFMRWLERQ